MVDKTVIDETVVSEDDLESVDLDEFDINDPDLKGLNTGVTDPTTAPSMPKFRPVDEGYYFLKVRPDTKKTGGYVYFKDVARHKVTKKIVQATIVVSLIARIYDRDKDKEGSYLGKNLYLSSKKVGTSSSLAHALYQITGEIPPTDFVELYRLTQQIFAENEVDGVTMFGKVRWVRSEAATTEMNGLVTYKFNAEGRKEYKKAITGQERITKLAVMEAKQEVDHWTIKEGETPEAFQTRKEEYVASAPDRAHIFIDPVSNEELSVQLEVEKLEDPEKFGITV
jgi:hypothetical protein